MKHCPECNFSFPESHRVCDFDGAELVRDESRALVRVPMPPRPSRLRRLLTSPGLITSLAMAALFLSAVLIGYFQPSNEVPPVVKDQPLAPLLTVVRMSETSDKTETPDTAKRRKGTQAQASRLRTKVTVAQAFRSTVTVAQASRWQSKVTGAQASRLRTNTELSAKLRQQPTSIENRSVSDPRASNQRGVVVATGSRKENRAAERENSGEKEPRLTAMLKTTWRVLKKPFKF